MIELAGDIFALADVDAIAITTNGITGAGGNAVMGRGIALQAKQRWPGIEKVLGRKLRDGGNHVYRLTQAGEGKDHHGLEVLIIDRWAYRLDARRYEPAPRIYTVPWRIYSLPTKYDWRKRASLDLIERSLWELRQECTGLARVALTRPGCSNGWLEWREVRPSVERILPEEKWVVVERNP